MKMFIVAAMLMVSAVAGSNVRILSEDSREVQEVFGRYSASGEDLQKNYCPHPEDFECPYYNKTLDYLEIEDKKLCCKVVDECLNITVAECCCEECYSKKWDRRGECVGADHVGHWVYLHCKNHGTGEFEEPNWYHLKLPTTCRCECEGHSCSASP